MILFVILWGLNIKDKNWVTISIIRTLSMWHIWLLATIYFLSMISSLNKYTLLGSEFLTSLVVLMILIRRKTLYKILPKEKLRDFIKINLLNSTRTNWKKWILFSLPWILFGVVIYISFKTIPYNYDSMTYHLPRIAHWAQNESVFPYATHITRQIGSTTLASYVCLYTYILAGKNDIFVNVIQGVSYGIDAYMVYSIARKLSLKRKYCVLAALLFMSLPIAFAEAMTTQNDLFSTVWLLFSVYILLDFTDYKKKLIADKESMINIFFMAVSFGFGYISKPAVCFAMLIALIWVLLCVFWRKDSVRTIIKMLIVGITTCLIIIIPTWAVNFSVWRKLSPSNVGAQQLIGTLDLRYIFMNFLKNSIYNLGNSVIPNFKDAIKNFLYYIAEILRVDLDDVVISEFGGEFGYSSTPYNCDTALNPLIMVLFLCAIVLLFITWKKQPTSHRHYALFTTVSYMTLCSFMIWQHFISRYIIGYFALMCPLAAICVQYVAENVKTKGRRKFVFLSIFVLSMGNWCMDLYHYYEDEPGTYFYYTWNMSHTYEKICNEIINNQYKKIGLVCSEDSYEYPLWAILSDRGVECEIQHVMVGNELARYEDINYTPDCIFVIDYDCDDVITYHGIDYIKTIKTDNERQLYLYEYER